MPFPNPKQVTSKEFGEDEFATLLTYIHDKVRYLKQRTRGLRETLIPKWIRTYHGIPSEQTATWPWPGAANLVIQIVGTFSDELLSRVMSLYQNEPLFVAKLLGNFTEENEFSGEDQREMLEIFLSEAAYEPEELDLFRVEETGFSSAIRYGTGIFKFPWEYVVNKQYVYVGGGTEEGTVGKYDPHDYIRRDGPHPEAVPLGDWMVDPRFPNLAQADFKVHTLHFNKWQLKNLKEHPEIYDAAVIDKILLTPDPLPDYKRSQESDRQMDTSGEGDNAENYDIHECWFTYHKDKETHCLIAYYHEREDLCLGIIENPYPELMEPFEDSKLAYDSEEYYGYGFCEMLESYQREISTTHNWRTNNRHFGTTGIGRINPNSKISSIVELFPGVLIPAVEGEIEPLAFGVQAVNYGTEDEQWTMQLAAARAGVDPAVGGTGGGITNPKKGIYSAQGTSIVTQQQNNRNNLRSSDMKSCHVRIGRKLALMYSHFGLGDKIRRYGNRAELLKKALENYKNKKLGLVIKPATASVNREMEKQNDILLSSVMERMYAWQAQVIQSIVQPGAPPELTKLLVAQLKASNHLFKHIFRNFGHDDASRLVPDILEDMKKERANANNGNGRQQPAVANVQSQGQNPGMVPISGGETNNSIPTATEG